MRKSISSIPAYRPFRQTASDADAAASSPRALTNHKPATGSFNPASLIKGVSKLILRNSPAAAAAAAAAADPDPNTPAPSHAPLSLNPTPSVPSTSPLSDDPDNAGAPPQTILSAPRPSRLLALTREKPNDHAAADSSNALVKSVSSAARPPAAHNPALPRQLSRGPKHHDARNHVQFSAAPKERHPRPSKQRNSWFAFARDERCIDQPRKRSSSRVRAKSRIRSLPSPGHKPNASCAPAHDKKKNPKELHNVVDFAVDEYFDSEEDEMEAGANVRSLAEDDFISYQTRHLKKADRAKNR
ncbi:unnamed protein product [Agarophyton chilense]